jgi:23S rRNA (uracil1939-C5)-methyltransferase
MDLSATRSRVGVVEEFLLELTDLAHGPYAVGRLDGQAVLVRGGAPGDLVVARIARRHARYLEAEILEVRRPGPGRRTAPCHHYPDCGGCSWQHLEYSGQLAAKASSVRRELARIAEGGPTVVGEPAAAPAEWAYRRRIRLHIDRQGRVGFLRARSHRVVEVDSCPVVEPALAAALAPARRLVQLLRTPVVECEVTARGELPGVALVLGAVGPPARQDRARVERFLAETPEVAGVVLAGRGWSRTWGDVRVRVEAADGSRLTLSPRAFSQVNEAANRLLIARVIDAASPGPGMRALELHAGAGNFTLALAPRLAALHAVERNPRAVAALKRAARRWPQVTVERAPASEVLRRLSRDDVPIDLVLVDPPRRGIREELAGLLGLRPRRIVYVSCDLATLTRDARALVARGYRLPRVDLVDLFPQTFHIELVARFESHP